MITTNIIEEEKKRRMNEIKKNANSCMSPKFINKMMKMARHIAEDNNACPSRKVGVVICDEDAVILGTGYNGPPRKTPHCDSKEYIKDLLFPKLSEEEKSVLHCKVFDFNSERQRDIFNSLSDDGRAQATANLLDGCKTCPRRFFNYGPGVRNDLCSCQHAETNAITNSNGSVKGGILFGWCITSCQGCTGAIINARIKEVHFLAGLEYSVGALKLYEYAGIPVFLHNPKDITNGMVHI